LGGTKAEEESKSYCKQNKKNGQKSHRMVQAEGKRGSPAKRGDLDGESEKHHYPKKKIWKSVIGGPQPKKKGKKTKRGINYYAFRKKDGKTTQVKISFPRVGGYRG